MMRQHEQMYALVSEYRQGNQSAKAFCATKNIRISTFQYWIRKQKKMELSGFIAIKTGSSSPSSQQVEIVYSSGIRLNLPYFDLHQISQLLNLR